jgi:DNA-binding IscR family transcriptional regulator
MPREPIPEDLRRFILTSVPSVPFVEALLIFREARGAPVTVDLLARRLYLAERGAAEVVEQLRAARFIEPVEGAGGHRFAPPPELDAMVEILAAFYRTHLVDVTDLIHSKLGRMAQQFANAFKLRKDS